MLKKQRKRSIGINLSSFVLSLKLVCRIELNLNNIVKTKTFFCRILQYIDFK